MADMFRSQGYRTCAIGKWHLGLGDKAGTQDWNAPLPAGLTDIGFDYHYIMAATADRVPCVFIENGSVANWDESAPIEVSYKQNFPGEPTGKQNPELCYNMKSSHGHNMSIVNGIGRIGYMKGGGKALWRMRILPTLLHRTLSTSSRQTRTIPSSCISLQTMCMCLVSHISVSVEKAVWECVAML